MLDDDLPTHKYLCVYRDNIPTSIYVGRQTTMPEIRWSQCKLSLKTYFYLTIRYIYTEISYFLEYRNYGDSSNIYNLAFSQTREQIYNLISRKREPQTPQSFSHKIINDSKYFNQFWTLFSCLPLLLVQQLSHSSSESYLTNCDGCDGFIYFF